MKIKDVVVNGQKIYDADTDNDNGVAVFILEDEKSGVFVKGLGEYTFRQLVALNGAVEEQLKKFAREYPEQCKKIVEELQAKEKREVDLRNAKPTIVN